TRTGRDVDGVITHAVPRDNLHPAIRPGNRGFRHTLQIDVQGVVFRGYLRRDLRIVALDPFPFEPRLIQNLEWLSAKNGLSARTAQIAEDTNLERHALPPTACRMRLYPSRRMP